MENFKEELLSRIYCPCCKTNLISNYDCNCKFITHSSTDYKYAMFFNIDNYSLSIEALYSEIKDNFRLWMGINLPLRIIGLDAIINDCFKYIEEKDYNILIEKIQNAINVTYHTKINLLFV